MTDAELRAESVDRPGRHASAPAQVPERGCFDVILQIGTEQGKRTEARENPIPLAGPVKPLEEFLEDEARRDDEFAPFEGTREGRDLGKIRGMIAPQGEGPDARIDEQLHDRERSDL